MFIVKLFKILKNKNEKLKTRFVIMFMPWLKKIIIYLGKQFLLTPKLHDQGYWQLFLRTFCFILVYFFFCIFRKLCSNTTRLGWLVFFFLLCFICSSNFARFFFLGTSLLFPSLSVLLLFSFVVVAANFILFFFLGAKKKVTTSTKFCPSQTVLWSRHHPAMVEKKYKKKVHNLTQQKA